MMKPDLKLSVTLLLFVAIIYIARQDGITPTRAVTKTASRILAAYTKPTNALCDGYSFETTYSSSEKDQASSLLNSLSSLRGGNKLETWILGGAKGDDFAKDYAPGLIGAAGAWIVMFLLTLICCVAQSCNWCCIYGVCKNCSCCACCKAPKTSGATTRYIVLSAIFLLGLAAVTIAGMVIAPRIEKGSKGTFCSTYKMATDIAYGNSAYKWMGIGPAIDSLDNLLKNINQAMDNLNSAGTGNDRNGLDTKKNDAKDTLQTLYTTSGSAFAFKPDPVDPTQYTPDFISNLGPLDKTGSYTFLLALDLETKTQVFKDADVAINEAITSITGNKGGITSAITTGKSTAENIMKSVSSLIDNFASAGNKGDDFSAKGKSGVVAAFGALFGLNALIVICIFLVCCLKCRGFNKLLHLLWPLVMLVALFGFALSAILFPTSIVIMEGCGILDKMLADSSYFNSILSNILTGDNTDAKDTIYKCTFGSGDILTQFNIQTQIGYFKTIYSQFDNIGPYGSIDNPTKPVAKDLVSQSALVEQLKNFQVSDAAVITTAISTLTKNTNKNQNTCTAVLDTWLLNSASCTNDLGQVFKSTDAANTNVGQLTCLGLDQWVDVATTNRYSSNEVPATCAPNNGQPELEYVNAFATNFKTNRKNVQTIFGTLSNSYVTYSGKQDTFANALLDFLNNFKAVKTALAGIQNMMIGTTDGLIANTNCKFVGQDLREFKDSLCVGFITSIFPTSIIIILSSIFSFFVGFCTFCIAKRINMGSEGADGKQAKYQVPHH